MDTSSGACTPSHLCHGKRHRQNPDRSSPKASERHWCGESISSATAESVVNQVISRRMVKKQQMRWSPRGAHLLLQVRTRVLNGDLAADFARWYPGFAPPEQDVDLAA